MLFLTTIRNNRQIERRLAGVAFSIKWQNVYRGLRIMSFGKHIADDALIGADEAYGISFNLIGFHLFIGCLLEATGRN